MASKANLRAAAVIVKIKNGSVLVATHVPAQADVMSDYSQTTLTAKMPSRHRFEGSIINGLRDTLGIGSSSVQKIVSFDEKFLNPENGKTYQWGLVILSDDASENPDTKEIKEFIWNPPAQLFTMMETMSKSRQEMFLYALGESVKHVPELAEFASRIVGMKQNFKQAA